MTENDKVNIENPITCDICGSPMVQWHCELICRNCGYRRDCTDS